MERMTFDFPRRTLLVALALLLLAASPCVALAQEGEDTPASEESAGEPAGEQPDAASSDAASPDATSSDVDDALADVPTDEGARERVRVDAPNEGDEAASARLRTNQRLREIGNQVDALKEDTFATKSRLLLLRESVLRRSIAGSKVVVVHENDLGSEFELVQVLYGLDREPKWTRGPVTDGSLDEMGATVVIDEKLVPGAHMLGVSMVLKGRSWGIFTYMEGYTFTVQAAHTFTAEEGVAHEIVVRASEDDDFFKPIEDRPTIAFEASTHPLESSQASAAAGK